MKPNHELFFILFLTATINLQLESAIKIVCTSALTNKFFEFRKQEYINSFNTLARLGYSDIYIIEALSKKGPTFLDDYSKNVFYASANNSNLRNNGINEAITLLEGCIYFDFGPEEMIIKLTGRHSLQSDGFLKIVENNPEFDAFVKINRDENVFTVGFAMKFKYLKEMFEQIDYNIFEKNMIPIEYGVGDYIKKKKKEGNFKVFYVDKLDIKSNSYASSAAPDVAEQTIFSFF